MSSRRIDYDTDSHGSRTKTASSLPPRSEFHKQKKKQKKKTKKMNVHMILAKVLFSLFMLFITLLLIYAILIFKTG